MTKEGLINFGEMFLEVNKDSPNSNTYEFIKKALELFKQEPCEDVISKKALYDALYDHFHEEDAPNNTTEVRLGAVRNFVRDFPTATPAQQWNTTPPTEEIYDILLSAKTEDTEPCVWMGFYAGGHYHYYGNGAVAVDDEVVAWMPAPKPLEAEMESEE